MKTKLLFLIFTQIGISQTSDVKQLLIDGEKAFVEDNFLLAKEIYTKVINLDKENKDGWFNLGAVELKLEENHNACENFYQAYLLNDGEVVKIIKENCPNFRNGSIMSINDVTEKPKFIYKGKEYLFIVNDQLNPKYCNLINRELKSLKKLMKYEGRIIIQFQINN